MEEVIQVNCAAGQDIGDQKGNMSFLKASKASSLDENRAEAIRADMKTCTEMMRDLIEKIYGTSKKYRQDEKEGTLSRHQRN